MTPDHPVDRIFAQHRARAIALYERLMTDGYDLDRAKKTILLARESVVLLVANLAYLAAVDRGEAT